MSVIFLGVCASQIFGDGLTESDETTYRTVVALGTMLTLSSISKEQFGTTQAAGQLVGLNMSARSIKVQEAITELKQAYYSMA